MTNRTATILLLSGISRYPDLNIDELSVAAEAALRDALVSSSPQDIISAAIALLPTDASEFERGVVGGIVLAQLKGNARLAQK